MMAFSNRPVRTFMLIGYLTAILLLLCFTTLPAVMLYSLLRSIARALRRIHNGRAHAPVLQEASLKLGHYSLGGFYAPSLRGSFDDRRLRIEPDNDPRTARRGGLSFTVRSSKELPAHMEIVTRDLRLTPPASPVRTFDPEFDAYFEVSCMNPSEVSVKLDAGIRNRLIALSSEGSIRIREGMLAMTTFGPLMHGKAIERTASRLLDLSRDLLAEDTKREARLLANAMSEPHTAARYQTLDVLLREHSSTREAEEALRSAWDAPERGIKYLAAVRRGEEGWSFLEEVAEERTETIRLRTMALHHLARQAPRERALPLLRRALTQRFGPLVRTAAELLGRLQDRESLPALVALARNVAADDDLRAIIAHALGLIGDTRAEDLLLSLLADPSLEVRFAAVQALGKAGTPQAITKLGRIGTHGARDLALSARSAIARIEGRFGPIERGRLSLTAGEELDGSLSFQNSEGAISLADPSIRDDVA
jgi:hypothetical protein